MAGIGVVANACTIFANLELTPYQLLPPFLILLNFL
jgi:hypothetical protein